MTAAALMVAVGSSSKRRNTEEEAVFLSRRIEQLSEANKSLEEKLRLAEGRYARSVALGKELNHALLEERHTLQEERQRSTALAEQLLRNQVQTQQAAAEPAPSAEPPTPGS